MTAIAVIMGSASDAEIVRPCLEILKDLEINFFVAVSSAHRTPQRTEKLVEAYLGKGARVFICAAGMAAHLAGAVAARTICPVIGIPVAGSSLGGMDALLSTVQMPAGFPVATVALNGAKNAAWLAAQILAVNDSALAAKIVKAREKMAIAVAKASEDVEESFC